MKAFKKSISTVMSIALVGSMLPFSAGTVLATDTGAARTYKDTFPKIAGIYIGGPRKYEDPAEQAQLAKHDLLLLGFWKSWNHAGKSIGQTVQEIKALHPGMLVGQYTNVMEHSTDIAGGGAEPDIYNKLSSELGPNGIGDWWARDNAGNWLSSYPGTANTNITDFVTPDANGDRVPQFMAKWYNSAFFSPVPDFDIWFSDNALIKPWVDADWDRNGTNDSQNDPAVRANWRTGMAHYWDAIKQLDPDALILANAAGDGSGNGSLREPEYKNKIAGAVFEGAMGKSWSIESWSTWETMMNEYRALMDNTTSPHLVVFNAYGDAGDYAAMRYGLASALMEDGYYSYSSNAGYTDSAIGWYDEYDVNLGKAIDGPQRSPWSNGVYRRRFENGIVLVNPKGNGTQTVTIGPGYKHILGTQDPSVNDGQPVTNVTLQERQGIILVKTADADSIRKLLERLADSNKLLKPLFKLLLNILEQVVHQLEQGHVDQAKKHIENFRKHLLNPAMQMFLSAEARQELTAAIDEWLGQLSP